MSRASNPTLVTLQNRIREQMNRLADDISTGGCVDFAEYKYKAGIIWGLGVAERELLDLNQELEEEV